jgi:hypothetical protein
MRGKSTLEDDERLIFGEIRRISGLNTCSLVL